LGELGLIVFRRRWDLPRRLRTGHAKSRFLGFAFFRAFHRLDSGHIFPTQMKPRPSSELRPPNKAPEPTPGLSRLMLRMSRASPVVAHL